MEIEHDVKVLTIDEDFNGAIERLKSEGWETIPGIKPVAVYHLARVKKPASAAAIGRMVIDESKIMVIPGNRKQ